MLKFRRLAAPVIVAVVVASLAFGAGSASAATLHSFTTHPTPKLSAAPKMGLPVSVRVGSWKPRATTYSYQWKIGGHSIAGATGSRYTPVAADLGHRLTITVTARKADYRTLSRTSSSSATAAKVGYQTFMTKSGLYHVSSKLKPDTYVALHAGTSCYWQRIGAPNIFGSIVGQNYLKGQAVLTIDPNDSSIQTGGCGSWIRLSDVPTKLMTSIPSSGDYLVGKQLAPGTYEATRLGSTCSWKTVRSFTGVAADDVIAHGEPTAGPVDVTITADVVGFLVDNCGVWSKVADPAPAPANN